MKGINRIVNTSFWNDSKVTEYFTPEDKYFMLYLLTNPHTTQLGIYEFPIKKVAFEMGYSAESIIGLIDRFQNKYGMIVYSSATNEILIKNFLRHSIVKGGKPVMDCLQKEERDVKDKTLLGYLYEYLDSYRDELNVTVIEYIDTLSKYIDNKNEKDNGNDIDNDNDNERIVDESSSVDDLVEKYYDLRRLVISESIKLPKQGEEVCEWCNNAFESLESHHFPVPKRNGGKDIVRICHTCHHKFHDYEKAKKIVTKEDKDKSIHDIVNYLNLVCGTNYKDKTANTRKHISARLNEGYTFDDFALVIDKKASEWKGTTMEQYLRPDTLFGTKFESYLNQRINKPKSNNERDLFAELRDC